MFIKHIAWFQCTPCGQSGFRSHPPKPATLWMLSQPSPVIVGLWPVSHMFYAGPSPAWTRGGQNTAALPKSGKELNMGIPLETIFIQGSCKCIVYLIPLKPSLGATTWVVVVFFGGQMNIARRMQFFFVFVTTYVWVRRRKQGKHWLFGPQKSYRSHAESIA